MKKVYLKCVYKRNLGDDLLIKTVCDRYKDTNFYVFNFKNGLINPKLDNLKEIKPVNIIYRFSRKLSHITNKHNFIENSIVKRTDMVLSVSGSLFMENKDGIIDDKIRWFSNLNKPLYMIGSNIGPVYTNEYLDLINEKVFNKAEDICLRDKKSYNYVKDNKKVRYAPDLVFNLDVKDYEKVKEENKVIISVINIDHKKSQMVNPNKEEYYKIINELINYFYDNKYEVELFSFCKSEEDDKTVNELLELNKDKNLKSYYYDGNVNEALEELSSSKIIVGSRFHANVLGLLLNKTIIPIIYNDKTRELLNDIKFKGLSIDLDSIKKIKINKKDLNYKLDISNYKEESKNHFNKLDKILK